MADKEIKIDLSTVTLDELDSIKSAVLKRLAGRATAPTGGEVMYDRHGSGHSRSTPPVATDPILK